MATTNSFYKLMNEDCKHRTGSIILSSIVQFFAWPVMALLVMSSTAGDYKAEYFISGIENQYVAFAFFIALVGSLICAVNGFGYLFNKSKTDYYHSIPVSRGRSFAVRYINGILIYAVPLIIAMFIAWVISLAHVGGGGLLARTFAIVFVKSLIFYLVAYSIFVLGIMLTGNVINYVIVTIIVGWFTAAVAFMSLAYCETFLASFSADFSLLSLNSWYYILSPATRLVAMAGRMNTGINLVINICTIIVLTGLSYFLFLKRRIENTEKSLIFEKLSKPLTVMITFIAGISMGLMFYGINANSENIFWLCFGLVAGSILGYMAAQSLFSMTVKNLFRSKVLLAVGMALSVMFAFSIRSDVFGFENYMPKIASVEDVKIRGLYNAEVNDSNRNDYNSLIFRNNDIEDAYKLIDRMKAENIRYNMENNEGINYDDVRDIYVTYQLKDGKEISRHYLVEKSKIRAEVNEADIVRSYSERVLENMKNHTFNNAMIQSYFDDGKYGDSKNIALTGDELKQFVKILEKDIAASTAENMKGSYPVARLELYDDHISSNRFYMSNITIFTSYKETCAFLKNKGLNIERKFIPLDEIEHMYKDDDSTELLKDEIAKIYNKIRPLNPILDDKIDSYGVELKNGTYINVVVD